MCLSGSKAKAVDFLLIVDCKILGRCPGSGNIQITCKAGRKGNQMWKDKPLLVSE